MMRPLVAASLLALAGPAAAEPRTPRPAEFALVFSFGYGEDLMPADDARFGELLAALKEAGFNTVHCAYTEGRLKACEKHGLKLMVDLLAPAHHVYKSPEKARAVCEQLRGHPAVWGYNLWNDTIGKTADGRRRDAAAVRGWDPTHPAFVGTYRTDGMRESVGADVMGYYDYHWKRGPDQHFAHLLRFAGWAKERDVATYRWLEVDAGRPGDENAARCLYSVNTSVACGLKGCLWFLGTELIDLRTLRRSPRGEDIARVNRQVAPLAAEVGKLGHPAAVYSTPVTRTPDDRPLPGGATSRMPPGLEANGLPAEFAAVRPLAGEFVLGVFRVGDADHFFLASHNAAAAQRVKLRPAAGRRLSVFDRDTGRWRPLEAADGQVELPLPPGGGELLRLDG